MADDTIKLRVHALLALKRIRKPSLERCAEQMREFWPSYTFIVCEGIGAKGEVAVLVAYWIEDIERSDMDSLFRHFVRGYLYDVLVEEGGSDET